MTIPVYLSASDSGQRAGVRRALSTLRETCILRQSFLLFTRHAAAAPRHINLFSGISAGGNAHSNPIGQCL